MAFKIAYGAGHYLHEAGNRIPAALDPAETGEWVLNDRVARYFAEAAAQYEGVELLRTDDSTGETETSLSERCRRANAFGADFALSIHHNAGANGTAAGGIEAFSYPGSALGARYRDAIYEVCVARGGLQGNRAEPRKTERFYVLGHTHMPCVLMEYGFMDSRQDAPVILQEAYARAVAYATMRAIAGLAGLAQKKEGAQEDSFAQFVRQVQAACGAAQDGIAGPETLGKTVTLSRYVNRTHPAVLPVQKRLAALGYSQVGQADGIAGAKFDAAVRAFQRDSGCVVDGELTAGNKSWRVLLRME